MAAKEEEICRREKNTFMSFYLQYCFKIQHHCFCRDRRLLFFFSFSGCPDEKPTSKGLEVDRCFLLRMTSEYKTFPVAANAFGVDVYADVMFCKHMRWKALFYFSKTPWCLPHGIRESWHCCSRDVFSANLCITGYFLGISISTTIWGHEPSPNSLK